MPAALMPSETTVDSSMPWSNVSCALAENEDDKNCFYESSEGAISYQDDKITISRHLRRRRPHTVRLEGRMQNASAMGDQNGCVHASSSVSCGMEGESSCHKRSVTAGAIKEEEGQIEWLRLVREVCSSLSQLARGSEDQPGSSLSDRLMSLGIGVQERLVALGSNVPERLTAMGVTAPESLESLRASIPDRLSSLNDLARRQLVVLRESLSDNFTQLRQAVVPQDDLWMTMSDFCARRTDDIRIQWLWLQSLLLERLTTLRDSIPTDRESLMEAMVDLWNLLKSSLALCWCYLTERLPTQDAIRGRLRVWRSIIRLQMMKESRKGGVWGSIRCFGLTQRDELCNCVRDLLDTEEDKKMADDVKFLFTDTEARVVFISLMVSCCLLMELLAGASFGNVFFNDGWGVEEPVRLWPPPGFCRISPLVHGI